MDEIRKANRAFLHDETVTIALENCSRTFTLSKALLCSASSYFSAALDGGFQEAADRTLRIPGCDEEVFQLFVYYLTHQNNLPELYGEDDDAAEFDTRSTTSQLVVTMLRLWKFADVCLLPKLQNEAMRLCCRLIHHVRVNASIARAAFEDTSTDSQLRQVIIDEAIWDWRPRDHDEPEVYEAMMDEVGAIPGFFSHFCREQAKKRSKAGGNTPSDGENWKLYKVDEN